MCFEIIVLKPRKRYIMKTLKSLFLLSITVTLLTSCTTEVVVDDFEEVTVVELAPVNLVQMLDSYELWYVDINATLGFGEIPFLQKAFTVSFVSGTVFTNTNLVGIGSLGNGLGIDVASFRTFDGTLEVVHDIDGATLFEVFQIDGNTLELYHSASDTSYFLKGFQRDTFDYDGVFYDNIHYFLQEYEAWEKVYTSAFGALNEFDNENYLQFLSGGDEVTFRSSQDSNGVAANNLIWDYVGVYTVGDIEGNLNLKTLTLDYDFLNNDFFELSVINDSRIQLFHPLSETVYEFEGRQNIQFLKSAPTKQKTTKRNTDKKRTFKYKRQDNPR